MRYDADRWNSRSFKSDESHFCHCITLWFRSRRYHSSKCYLLHLIAAADAFRRQLGYVMNYFTPNIIPLLLRHFNFLSYALHAFWYYDEGKIHELWNDRSCQTMYPLKTSALPISGSSPEKKRKEKKRKEKKKKKVWNVGCVGENMEIFSSRWDIVTRLCEYWRYHQEVVCFSLFRYQRFFGVTVASHYNLQYQARCKTLSISHKVWQDCLHPHK